MLWLHFVAGLLLVPVIATNAIGADTGIRGTATVVDGDQLVVQGYQILLFGIDAPDLGQECEADGISWPCGQAAAQALTERIGNETLECADTGDAPYAKVSAVCSVAETDLNGWLVSQGWALAARKFTRAYVEQEGDAKKAKRGMWRGRFVKPSAWRRGERLD